MRHVWPVLLSKPYSHSLVCEARQAIINPVVFDTTDQASELSSGISQMCKSRPANHTAMYGVQAKQNHHHPSHHRHSSQGKSSVLKPALMRQIRQGNYHPITDVTVQPSNKKSHPWCASQAKPSSSQSSLTQQPRQVISPQAITDEADQASELSSGLSLM